MRKFLGVDIGGTKCAILLAEADGGIHILDKEQFDTLAEQGSEQALQRICQSIAEIMERQGLTKEDVAAIGIACGGPLDSARGRILSPPNLPGWDDVPIVSLLSARFGVPAYLQNDANACALVEWKLGAGRGMQDMVFLTMGTGMGAGIIAEGRLLNGHNNMGGEVGHLRLAEDGPVGFGKAGSFEGFCSGGGMRRQIVDLTRQMIAAEKPPAWVLDGHSEDAWDSRLIAEYARKGDMVALQFYEETGRMLGRGISLLVDMLNPEGVIIGSNFVRYEALLRPAMEEALRKEALSHSLRALRVMGAGMGEALGDYASIMVALHALAIDPLDNSPETDASVLSHFEQLFERYPALFPCREQVMAAYMMLLRCYRRGNKVLLVGNGGSCADCEHIVGELMKGFLLTRPLSQRKKEKIREQTEMLLPHAADLLQQGLPAIALSSHAALSTAVQNDLDAALVAAQQVVGYGVAGDVLIGISSSGNAKNVQLAIATANAMGLETLGLTGKSGGALKQLCDSTVMVPAVDTAQVQELHLPVYHTLCAMVEAKFFKE